MIELYIISRFPDPTQSKGHNKNCTSNIENEMSNHYFHGNFNIYNSCNFSSRISSDTFCETRSPTQQIKIWKTEKLSEEYTDRMHVISNNSYSFRSK